MDSKEIAVLLRLGHHIVLDDYDLKMHDYLDLISNLKLTSVGYADGRESYIIAEDVSYTFRNIKFGMGSIAFEGRIQ